MRNQSWKQGTRGRKLSLQRLMSIKPASMALVLNQPRNASGLARAHEMAAIEAVHSGCELGDLDFLLIDLPQEPPTSRSAWCSSSQLTGQ